MGCLNRIKTLFVIVLILYIFYFFLIVRPLKGIISSEKSIHCYRETTESLQDINDIKIREGKSIFFHETSCKSFLARKIVISSRQACAVESAAKWNPNLDVYLTFTSPAKFHFKNTTSDHFLQSLLSYKNIKILHLNYARYMHGTLVEHLYEGGAIEKSRYPMVHASDVLRYVTLFKYGGFYMDLDVVVLKCLETLRGNFAGIESNFNVGAGVMRFSPLGIGHSHAKSCLQDLNNSFTGYLWGYNAPGVITRLLKRLCGAEKAIDMLDKNCQGVKVYPPHYFYPVLWWNWTMYFEEEYFNDVISMSKSSYAVHVWNKHSGNTKVSIKKSEKIAYAYFAKNNCPKVFAACDDFF